MLGMKSIFDDPMLKHAQMEARIKNLTNNLNKYFNIVHPIGPGLSAVNDFKGWLKKTLELKKKLMYSSHDYHMHFCRPGDSFNKRWMNAITVDGRTFEQPNAPGLKVALCLFPAMTETETPDLPDNTSIEDALATNKRFFPTSQDSIAFDFETVRAKAYVLLM